MSDDIPIQLLATVPFFSSVIYDNIIGVIILILLAVVVSSSKYAIFSLNRQQLKQIKVSDSKKYKIIVDFIQKSKEFLTVYVFSVTLFCFGIIILSEDIVSLYTKGYYGEKSWLLFSVKVFTGGICILYITEIIPKILGRKYNYSISIKFIYIVWILSIIFKPFIKIFVAISGIMETQIDNNSNNLTAEDIDDAIDNTTTDEHKKNDSQILKGLIKFGNIPVSQIMRSRIDVVAVDKNKSLRELLELVKDSGYSRIPVYEDSMDKISGIIYAKDLLMYLDEPQNFDWQQLIKPAFFIPDSKKLDDLLEDFQNKRIHMAVIVDEYGGTLGIVTLEDVLEEVIGDIKDEFDDVAEIDYKKIDNHNYIFEARTAINDVYKVLEIKDNIFDKIRGDADSLAGLMLEMNHDIPKEGDELEYENYKFIILEANATRVIRIKIIIK